MGDPGFRNSEFQGFRFQVPDLRFLYKKKINPIKNGKDLPPQP
jgi:hypothetical protein